MDDWIDYYDSDHTIYVSPRHREVHFKSVADDIVGLIPSPEAVVLDYACGEALGAARVADACCALILAEPAPGVRRRVAARFSGNPKIRVRALDELPHEPAGSVDLAVMNSVSQYMTSAQIDEAFTTIHRLLRPEGRLVLGDVLRPDVGPLRDAAALIGFAARHGFLIAAFTGLVRTALSDYRKLRSRVGLQTYAESDMLARLAAAGFTASRATTNLGHNPWRMTFVARPKNR
jgi:SAM-dependent methyltransferase